MEHPNYVNDLNNIKNELMSGNLGLITLDLKDIISLKVIDFLKRRDLNKVEVEELKLILEISNILYNNTTKEHLLVEDGVYDMLIELYRVYNPNIPIGATPINFDEIEQNLEKTQMVQPFIIVDRNDLLYVEDIVSTSYDLPTQRELSLKPAFNIETNKVKDERISKRIVGAVSHDYPKLVGTLDKCKFVLNHQAEDAGVISDPTVKVFERDFINKHINMGIIDPMTPIRLMLMLKYDGISVEATVSNRILSARTRGDTTDNRAADLTPILFNYPFPKALKAGVPDDNIFGMKYEAIITHSDLAEFNRRRIDKVSDYKNARTAIIGLFGASDAYKFTDLITLVPLATSLDVDRVTEAEFMNQFYSTKEPLRATIVEGTLHEVLFKVKRYVEEAEYMQDYMPFMYDGVVVSYIDDDIIAKLGRVNSVNQYEVAIKFNPMKKQTIFRGYTYTVGQDGIITPMIHYDPVEFYGTIHPKSSGHSYKRFKELDLRIGDMLDITYVNQVMPYVNKPDNSHNAENAEKVQPVIFPLRCPECNSELMTSPSGKSKLCTNIECPGRIMSRVVNMMSKLNLKDFGEENLRKISKYSLKELLNVTKEDLESAGLGPIMTEKFMERIAELRTTPIDDFKIVGSLGFNGIAKKNWELILRHIMLEDILNYDDQTLKHALTSIKGIGKSKAETIIEERKYFIEDLKTILSMRNVKRTTGMAKRKSVRFTGVRNAKLINKLNALGFDADGNASVTKSTDILVVPMEGHTSSKTKKVSDKCIIVPIDVISENPESFM